MAPMDYITTNVTDGETVHQRCLLVIGECRPCLGDRDIISVKTIGSSNIEAFPEQTWPLADGRFKALVMLSPGHNILELTHLRDDNLESTVKVTVTYIPLLQNPPLHLAIMVAKDSPLLIDCPSFKGGAFSSAHSDLEAAIAKLRMTAYMWQAMTAEDLRMKGLGRRTFRLEEEWAADTVSREFMNAAYDESLAHEGAMRSTAKVHIVRSSKTTKEIRAENVAQQNQSASRSNDLHAWFSNALKEAEGPFASSAHPIVAGLILDSHYSITKDLILGHAALGSHNPRGLSLGIFGSHLTYSWPRCVEEVTSCLTDIRVPGDMVGNDNGECCTMWEACTVGQGAHLHEVGHAFGLPHRKGIMERGYSRDWAKNFLSKTASCGFFKAEGILVDNSTSNDARWGLSDALCFRALPHFRLPTDQLLPPDVRHAAPQCEVQYEGQDNELSSMLCISSPVGIVLITFNDCVQETPTLSEPVNSLRFSEQELEERFNRTEPLSLCVLGTNGKESKVANVWTMLANHFFVRIPGSTILLSKRSVHSEMDQGGKENRRMYHWAQLLREKGADGKVHGATSIDLRVGAIWDGGVVKYADGHVSHWGAMFCGGRRHQFGGHASEKIRLPPNVTIQRIDINKGYGGDGCMDGVRMHLSNGKKAGELNRERGSSIAKLEPGPHEVIVGFYGKSEGQGYCGVNEFGIITAPKSVGLDGLPDAAFDLPELRNTGGKDDKSQTESHYSGSDDRSNTMDSEGNDDGEGSGWEDESGSGST